MLSGVTAYDDLSARLRNSQSAPFLFVGAGLSLRYLKTDSWVGLLKRLAAMTGKPYGYYASKADNIAPEIATQIADVFFDIWWEEERFAESRALYGDSLTTRDGPLKVEVARLTQAALDGLPSDGAPLAREVALLRDATVDGVITTNYDGLMEVIFPDFKPYVGQDELLFSDTQGVGEIYKIHGSADVPESFVLTSDDYEEFNERNPYLAAKLLTIFVEHPVLFIGYSLNDADVSAILVSIARVLTTENLNRLQDRLIFVQWDRSAREPTLVSTQIAVDNFTLPVVLLTVADFEGVFEVLGSLPRKFPARVLRRLKEHVYDLVLTNDPDARMAVVDIDDGTHADDIDVVFGVGIQRRLGVKGYVGLTRADLIRDVLLPESDLDAHRVVDEALPRILRQPGNTPVLRYLRAAGYLSVGLEVAAGKELDRRVRERLTKLAEGFPVPGPSKNRADSLVKSTGGSFAKVLALPAPTDVLLATASLPAASVDLDALRAFLRDNLKNFDGSNGPTPTAWAKLVCLYDLIKYGDDTP